MVFVFLRLSAGRSCRDQRDDGDRHEVDHHERGRPPPQHAG
jgi:hypothetical protein